MPDKPRREADRIPSLDIEQMILQEDDQKQRAFLIVLHSINKSLIANTDTIRDVSDKLEQRLVNFEKHQKAEDAVMNKGRGAWKVVAWVIGIVQVVGLAIWANAREEIKDIHTMLQTEQVMLADFRARLSIVEQAHGSEKK